MQSKYLLKNIARFAEPGDNVVIGLKKLEAGTKIWGDNGDFFVLPHTLLEGHRFAVKPIPAGEAVLSWGLPFGLALCDISPGDYICNADIIDSLRGRRVDFDIPEKPNFKNHVSPYIIDESTFVPGDQVVQHSNPPNFNGFDRGFERGVGTRNYIVLMAITSQAVGFLRQLEAILKEKADQYKNIDGVVAVLHTEGDNGINPNNRELVLRTLAGFMIHPNVGAVLAVDRGTEAISGQMLKNYMQKYCYPLNKVLHRFETLTGSFNDDLKRNELIVTEWLDPVNKFSRQVMPGDKLNIALQCGGSDSYSGISGNPLAANVVKELISFGGRASIAETDELIGSEPYLLQNVRDIETARTFLNMIKRFEERTGWHGQSVDANPSGGNKYRGIYNIVLKSIGAARKRNPDVRLDYAINYAIRMEDPGFYFMDSPGNDLESIAGQVAAGGNLIFFITGNGSITNFPFVPTIKIVTTTKRFELLSEEMDVNAGLYLDGVSMNDLTRKTLDLTLQSASGKQTRGELAGHSQTQIWRDWKQTDRSRLNVILDRPVPNGKPLTISSDNKVPTSLLNFSMFKAPGKYAIDRLGIILPTSLCSGQIAQMAADRLNQKKIGSMAGISRFTALVHTEGCGASGGTSEEMYVRTMIGYLTHSITATAMLLEHGCERTHNDFFHQKLIEEGLDPNSFGWASVQVDGGIEKVLERIESWFINKLANIEKPISVETNFSNLQIGISTSSPVSTNLAHTLVGLILEICKNEGTVVIPDNSELLSQPEFKKHLPQISVQPTLVYGKTVEKPGLHIMETQTTNWVETATGMGATGVDMILLGVENFPSSGHPMIPLLQIGTEALPLRFHEDVDLILTGDLDNCRRNILRLIIDIATQKSQARANQLSNIDFQVTRGLLGVSV
tara:strand:- start:45297 stop:48002 length:2706 start_codon:yes stop_codon:yes gene_type:complete